MLDITRLENVCRRGDKITAACPACRAEGSDKKGNHLFYNEKTEVYGCAKYQGDSEHRKAIWAQVGIPNHREYTPEEKRRWSRDKSKRRTVAALESLKKQKFNKIEDQKIAQALELFQRLKTKHFTDCWRSMIHEGSPLQFDIEDPRNAGELIHHLFDPDDFIWNGGLTSSGSPAHTVNFLSVEELLKRGRMGDRITGSTFKKDIPMLHNRAKEHIDRRLFILVESDDLIGKKPENASEAEENKALSACLFPFLTMLGLTIRVVLDSGGKSLHFWVDYSEHNEALLLRLAEGLHLDRLVIANGAAPLRLPGCIHEATMKPANLIYLNPIRPITF
jgi:hypothetical protein